MRALATTAKAVAAGPTFVVATVYEVDLLHAVRLALLQQERVHDGASPLLNVSHPILLKKLPKRDLLAGPVKELERRSGLARLCGRRRECAPREPVVRRVVPHQVRERHQELKRHERRDEDRQLGAEWGR